MNKNLIIGLDGVPYSLLDNLISSGLMPNLKQIIDKGSFTHGVSTLPEISSVAWSSIITGKNPGEHGIFGFTDFVPGTYNIKFPNFRDLQSKPFWEIHNERKSIIVNVPSTFPAYKSSGYLISGFVALELERSVYPKSIIPELEALNYKIDVDANKAHESIPSFVEDLFKVLEARLKLFEKWYATKEWDDFMFVITGTDRLMHFLWNAYENKEHTHHNDFINYFKKIDKLLFASILEKLNENISLLIFSDHGFETLEKEIYVNNVLIEKNLLSLNPAERKMIMNMNNKSKVFCLDPSRLYINEKGKYPEGSVDTGDKEKIINDTISLFDELKYEGQTVIKKIYRKEEAFRGLHLDKAPDLLFLTEKGFGLRAGFNSEKNFDSGSIFSGKHTYDDTTVIAVNVPKPNIYQNGICVENLLAGIGLT